jgi:hypothetical protein
MSRAATSSSAAVHDAVLGHLLDVLDRVTVFEEPFCHFYIENAFPADIYRLLLESLPDPACYWPDNPSKYLRADGLNCRSVLGLDDVGLGRMRDDERELWTGVAGALSDAALKRRIFDLLAPDLCRRFRVARSQLDSVEAHPRPALVRDIAGYWIEPHPDSSAKIVTTQFYLATDAEQMDFGTALYRRRLFKLRNLVSPSAMFEKVKQFEFRPNTGYAFAVGRRSWHGREKLPDTGHVRNSIMNMNIYYGDPTRRW